MRKPLIICLLGFEIGISGELYTAASHPMQYYASLPDSWSAGKRWPVVFVIDSANRDFEAAAELYRGARGGLPFILVTPLVITNGGPRYRELPSYHYSAAVWAQVEKLGGCRFDSEGLAAVARDVLQRFGGEDRYFITGLEAAGHTIWMQIFTHPEAVRAAAPVAPNFQSRCLDEIGYSASPLHATLPVKIFGGATDESWAAGKPFRRQTEQARSIAAEHGYRNVSEVVIPGKGHEPLAAEVLAYFASLLGPSR